jgi:hypothetical protein
MVKGNVYLFLEQWHLLPEPEKFPETLSECSWHLFLYGAVDSGGFPPETAGAGATKIDDPSFPLETLPSPVIADDMIDEVDDTLKLSLVKSSSVVLGLEAKTLGFEKSKVKLCC